ncbi:hypothetical protein Nepgr_008023 [Nepenthes gracilis]|uniref:Uncharacterized protein n=1 Tax=Nepenthes gracilis TaxID=150966 RepID=A0AAD3S7X9_NEPGR|nr:hypothetical protein Nepgr_008023 [Nepenthes gracilis]
MPQPATRSTFPSPPELALHHHHQFWMDKGGHSRPHFMVPLAGHQQHHMRHEKLTHGFELKQLLAKTMLAKNHDQAKDFNFCTPIKGYQHQYPSTWTPADEIASQGVLTGELGISIREEKLYLTGVRDRPPQQCIDRKAGRHSPQGLVTSSMSSLIPDMLWCPVVGSGPTDVGAMSCIFCSELEWWYFSCSRCLPILAQFQLETTDPVSSFGKFGMKSWQPDAIFKLELWLKASFSLGMPKELVHPVVEIF